MSNFQQGVKDAIKAFTFVSALVAVHDVVTRTRKIAEAKAQHQNTKTRLHRIERGIQKIHEKLS